MVVICSARSMESSSDCLLSTTSPESRIMWQGSPGFFRCLVNGTTLTVSAWIFAVSFEITSTGLHPPWTLVPVWLPRSANHISPRQGAGGFNPIDFFCLISSSQSRLHGGNQFLLGYIFTGQRRQYILVHCVLRDYVVDGHGLCLSLSPQSCIGLLVQFETPR